MLPQVGKATKVRAVALLYLLLIAQVQAVNLFVPNDQPFGFISPPVLSVTNLSAGNGQIFAPWFENGTFQGDLISAPINSSGQVQLLTPTWRAQTILDAQDWNTGRFIVTNDGAGSAIPLRFPSLSAAQQILIGTAGVIDYARGDRSGEIQNGGLFRDRFSVLGDIIHSNPVYVAGPRAGYIFDGYPGFAVANAARPPRVYVGSNDGMLHAFDALSGNEKFAFVPATVIGNLAVLSASPYAHQYFVDGLLNVADVCFNCPNVAPDWHTVLVGGLGAGGKGFYALDITQASAITAEDNTPGSGAGSKFLWEFTANSDADMGFSYSRPSIVRLNDGTWAAVFGNGYVNGGSGSAALYVVNIATGALIKKLVATLATDSLANPNGLSSPTVVDENGDFRADRVYAGDLKGNIWRFNIGDVDPLNWTIAYSDVPLFSATDSNGAPQAVTTALDVTLHPSGGFLVYFGTGKLLEAADATNVATQSVYGIWDHDWAAGSLPTSADLVSQTLTELTHAGASARVRVATDNAVNYAVKKGWRVDLPAGERVQQAPLLRDRRIQLTSVNPSIQTGENWFLQLDYLTGGSPSKIIIDVDGNGIISTSDNVDGNSDGDTNDVVDRVVGQYQGFGLASRPTFGVLSASQDAALINHLRAIDPAVIPPSPTDPGLLGGHFDLDTSHLIYAFNSGVTDHHVHQWDDKTGLTTVDYMNMVECSSPLDQTTCVNSTGYSDIDERITNPDRRFILIIANAALSPGGVLEINGVNISVVAYQAKVAAYSAGTGALPVYKLGPLSAQDITDGVQRLTSLKISFDVNAILNGELIPTNTGCVKGNNPGANMEYRNGALLIQALDANLSTLNASQLYATSGLLWESTMFWHWDPSACYGDATWQASYTDCVVNGNFQNCVKASSGGSGGSGSAGSGSSGSGSSGSGSSGSGSSGSGSSGSGSSGSSSSGSGSGGGGAGGGVPPVVVPLDPQQDVTNTTGSGNNQTGRLLWREIVF